MQEEIRKSGARPQGARRLTPRMLECLGLYATGKSKRQIAAQLYLSYATVCYYINCSYALLGVNSLLTAIVAAKKQYPDQFLVDPAILDAARRESSLERVAVLVSPVHQDGDRIKVELLISLAEPGERLEVSAVVI